MNELTINQWKKKNDKKILARDICFQGNVYNTDTFQL